MTDEVATNQLNESNTMDLGIWLLSLLTSGRRLQMIIKTAPIAKHIINSSSVNQMRYLWPCDLELREVEGSFCVARKCVPVPWPVFVPVVADGARSLSSRSDSLPKYGLMLFSSAIKRG